jgi:phosphoglycerol transferase MdoB-like AlkP superfamily enzyme
LNTPFMILKTFKKSSLERQAHFENHSEALKLVNGGIESSPVLPLMPSEPRQNVVIVILESFSWEYTSLNPQADKSYTPFLDSLMRQSLVFSKAMASGRRSSEGVAAILSGIPALMEEPFITSEFSTNQFEGLGHVFTKAGYDTSFYHGGENGTMHFDAFSAKAGFQKYFGSKQYPKSDDYDGIWGIWDRPYLQYFAQELDQKPRPFLSVVFTLSSHQPYRVPAGEPFADLKTPHPILNAVAYTDSALKDFFATVEKTEWYSNTLFVILADHTGPQVSSEFDDKIAAYRIPILFYHPRVKDWPSGIERDSMVQHIDIAASLYDLLGLKGSSTSLSRSVFRPGPRTFTAYVPGLYIHTDGKTVLIEQNKKNSFIDFNQHRQFVEPSPELEKSLRAVKDIFSQGLWDNSLYF